MDCKLIRVTDEGTDMGFLAIRLDPDEKVTTQEAALLREWGYAPDYGPGYMLFCNVKGGNPIEASINEYGWRIGGTVWQAYRKTLATWDSLTSGDTVDVEAEREAWNAEQLP